MVEEYLTQIVLQVSNPNLQLPKTERDGLVNARKSGGVVCDDEDLHDVWLRRCLIKWRCRYQNCTFTDLRNLPPEIGLKVLSNLDADELNSVSGIWSELADDNSLWKRLCYLRWGYCSAYRTPREGRGPGFWKHLYKHLELATRAFNSQQGLHHLSNIFQCYNLVDDTPKEWADFLFNTDLLEPRPMQNLLLNRPDILRDYMWKHNFTNMFLPVALRSFFFKLSVRTTKLSAFTNSVFQEFTSRYCHCNPAFNPESVLVLVYSLNILSNDFSNPNIRNKMSKREYIKNTIKALEALRLDYTMIDEDYLCHMYDNVYLIGHIAPVRFES